MTTETRPANRKATASFLTQAQYIAADAANVCSSLEKAQKLVKNAYASAEARRGSDPDLLAAYRRTERRFYDAPESANKALDLALDLLAEHPKYQALKEPGASGLVEVPIVVGEEPVEDAGGEEQEG